MHYQVFVYTSSTAYPAQGQPEPIPDDFGQEAEYTLNTYTVLANNYSHSHSHHRVI